MTLDIFLVELSNLLRYVTRGKTHMDMKEILLHWLTFCLVPVELRTIFMIKLDDSQVHPLVSLEEMIQFKGESVDEPRKLKTNSRNLNICPVLTHPNRSC